MSSKPLKSNTVVLQELYAETMTEQTILCAIQAHNNVQKPTSLTKNILLLSHANDYKNSVLQCAAYGFWAIEKKKCVFILVDESEEIIVQNPRTIESLGKNFKNAIRSKSQRTSTSNRIHKGIQKHLAYLRLLTQVEEVSIVHIPLTQVWKEITHNYIRTMIQKDTMLIFISNNTDDGLASNEYDGATYTLYKHVTSDKTVDTLACKTDKEVFGIMRRPNYLHLGA